ncbi:hypothetical protein MH117_22080 [Paenibacillus sp. ACRRX]|uniref:hypothetical protein n=1 Tax=unclassified Paenibacillus TaxID=185978 RepID=UPI001EF5A7B4|nr:MULTISPECIES: hypothetical protein [unclassified Paenibacillus]MCG7410106.1 hypothetical protein [Paenibacillus sp. ACRRX]MDK8183680.1 hypothetical protein [Paenibacillus sp. UMB4589-SE434]
MGVYYSTTFNNPETQEGPVVKVLDLHITNQHHRAANVLIRLICNGVVVAEHLNRLKAKNNSASAFKIQEMRLQPGAFGIQIFTTTTGHHPLVIQAAFKDGQRSVIRTIGMEMFTEVDIV